MNKVTINLEVESNVKPDGALYDLFQRDADFREAVLGELKWKAVTAICHHSGCGRDRIKVVASIQGDSDGGSLGGDVSETERKMNDERQ